MGKYLTVLRVGLADRFAYRGDFFFGTLMRLVPFATVVFFWDAVMSGAGSGPVAFGGYDARSIVAYFILVFLGRAFSSMPGLSRSIAQEVREGGLNKFLVRPVDYPTYQLLLRFSHKLVYILTMLIPFGAFVWLMAGYFTVPVTPVRAAGAAASLMLGFWIGFHLSMAMGCLSFWMLEVTTLLFALELIEYFLSGQMIPLDLLPRWVTAVSEWLPFQFGAFLPAAILLGRVPEEAVGRYVLLGVAWSAALWALTRLLFAAGVRRYTAFGG